jgi:hypothetical protein
VKKDIAGNGVFFWEKWDWGWNVLRVRHVYMRQKEVKMRPGIGLLGVNG